MNPNTTDTWHLCKESMQLILLPFLTVYLNSLWQRWTFWGCLMQHLCLWHRTAMQLALLLLPSVSFFFLPKTKKCWFGIKNQTWINVMPFFFLFRSWDHPQVTLDGPAGDTRGQFLTSFGPAGVTSVRNGQQLPQLHLGPSPHCVSDCVDAVYLLWLPGPVVGWSGQPCTK